MPSDNNSEAIEWGLNYLVCNGYSVNTPPENVQNTPWSYVIRFSTSNGYIYLKKTPKLLSLEADITKILDDQFNAPVPKIIAHNPQLYCFLMHDAGKSLREILKKRFDVTLLRKAVDQFISLQLSVADQVDIFFRIGVPDYRLNKLTDLFKELILKKDILLSDGLTEKEIRKLESLIPVVFDLCKKLSGCNIKETLVQPDFHDNNILVYDVSKKITIIDFGEIVISHPFFSLHNFLYQIKKHHGLKNEDEIYQHIVNAGLKNFTLHESKENVLNAFTISRILGLIYGALANYRLMIACGNENLKSFQGQGGLSDHLKEFITLV